MKEEDGKEIMGKARAIYRSLFFKEAAIPARIGKTVYVRKEYHERIQLILRVIGRTSVAIQCYIDNVLAHHFQHLQEEIKKLYEQNNNLF